MEEKVVNYRKVKKTLNKVLNQKIQEMLPRSAYYKLNKKIKISVETKSNVNWRCFSAEKCVVIYFQGSIEVDWSKILFSKQKNAIQSFRNVLKFQKEFRDEIDNILGILGYPRPRLYSRDNTTVPFVLTKYFSIQIKNPLWTVDPILLDRKIKEIKQAIRGVDPSSSVVTPKLSHFIHGIKVDTDKHRFNVSVYYKKNSKFQPTMTQIVNRLRDEHPSIPHFIKPNY